MNLHENILRVKELMNLITEEESRSEKLFDFIDSLKVDDYIKNALKSNEDLLILWNANYMFNTGMKDLMRLFEPSVIDYYNGYISELGQDSHINTFYDSVDELVEVIDRILKYSNDGFVMSEIFGYCNPAALRYMSDTSIEYILKNKHLIRKFQALWVTKVSGAKSPNSEHGEKFDKIPSSKWKSTGVKPFVPTSDEEQEEKILEIILDNTKTDFQP